MAQLNFNSKSPELKEGIESLKEVPKSEEEKFKETKPKLSRIEKNLGQLNNKGEYQNRYLNLKEEISVANKIGQNELDPGSFANELDAIS